MFVAALQRLAGAGELVLDGAFVRLASHTVRLAPGDEAAWALIAPRLGGAERFRPPRVRDLADATGRPERDIRRLLKLAGRMGWADEIAQDHFFLRATVREMIALCVEEAGRADGGAFTAAQFRDRVASGRKVAIQILEFFDRHGVTLRKGDLRRINPHRLDLFGPFGDFIGRCGWRRIVPGGAFGLQIRVGQRACPRWVRLPFSSAIPHPGANPDGGGLRHGFRRMAG